jgi:hypothetical protein
LIPTKVMAKLATLGLSEEQVEAVATMLTQVEDATEETVSARFEAVIEDGREKGRERWRRWDEKRRSNVGKREQTLANTSRQLAHTEDLTSNSDINTVKEERKKTPRSTRLAPDWSLPVEWRQDALEAGLPEARIDPEALNMRDWSLSSAKGVKLDWRASWRGWCRRAAKDLPRAGPQRVVPLKDTPANAARRRIEEAMTNGRNGSETDGNQPVAGLISGHSIRLVG